MECTSHGTRIHVVVWLQVNEILSRSTVWSAFKDQKHDLFISDSQTAGYLTGKNNIHFSFVLCFSYFELASLYVMWN